MKLLSVKAFDIRSRPPLYRAPTIGSSVRQLSTPRPPMIRGMVRGAPLGTRPAVRSMLRGGRPMGRGSGLPGRPMRPNGAAPPSQRYPQPYSSNISQPRTMLRGVPAMPRLPAGPRVVRPRMRVVNSAPVAPPSRLQPEPQPWEHYYQLD